MQIIIFDTSQDVAENAGQWILELIKLKNNAVLGLATGSTPISLYQQLVAKYQAGSCNFSQITSFNLDEYYQIKPDNPQSYRSFMQKHLFNHVNILNENTHLPTCDLGQNPRDQGLAYEQKIKEAGGIDLQILGIGANGHIGFNEPTSSLNSRTRIKTLTEQTITDNSRLFALNEWQPTMAMTMGIATIMEAKYVLLMATGTHKAEAVKNMITGAVSANCPASILQMHKNAIILLDNDAASQLADKHYYQWTAQQNNTLNEQLGLYPNL